MSSGAVITPAQAAELIRASNGVQLLARIEKADGSCREMRCRYVMAKPVKQHRSPNPHCIVVFDDDRQAYRTITLSRLRRLCIMIEVSNV